MADGTKEGKWLNDSHTPPRLTAKHSPLTTENTNSSCALPLTPQKLHNKPALAASAAPVERNT
jgi:hypothetical protein